MPVKTIILRGDGVGKEAIAAVAITPGMLIERTTAGEVQPNTNAGAQAAKLFARENEVFGKDIDEAYAIDDQVLFTAMNQGAEIFGLIGLVNITENDFLVSAGDGTMKAIATVGIVPQATGIVTDDDSAASNGLAVYLHTDETSEAGGPFGHLESVTAGDANANWDIGAAGPRIEIQDDDAAATAGFQIYFDEDAANDDERFLADISNTLQDVFVLTSSGQAVRIKHDASASSNGVAIFFDDDAANEEDRMLFISPTDTAGSFKTDDEVSVLAYTGPESAIAQALETVANSGGSGNVRLKFEVI